MLNPIGFNSQPQWENKGNDKVVVHSPANQGIQIISPASTSLYARNDYVAFKQYD